MINDVIIILGGLTITAIGMWMVVMAIIQLGDDDEFKKWLSGK
jgi:hypothetical protein